MNKWKMIMVGAMMISQAAMAELTADQAREINAAVTTEDYVNINPQTVKALIQDYSEMNETLSELPGGAQIFLAAAQTPGYGAHSCAEFAKANKCKAGGRWDPKMKSCVCI